MVVDCPSNVVVWFEFAAVEANTDSPEVVNPDVVVVAVLAPKTD